MPMREELYVELIWKEADGALTSEESVRLQTWLDADPEHAAKRAEIREAWEATAELTTSPDLDLDAEFALLDARMSETATEGAVENPVETPSAPATAAPAIARPLWRRGGFLAAAASVLLLAVVGWYLYPPTNGTAALTTFSSENESATRTLWDGTRMTLAANSEVKYPAGEAWTADRREVSLKGEARFEVPKDAQQRPFVVTAGEGTIRVLGTVFTVKAFADSPDLDVEVTSGKVEFSVKELKTVISAGEKAKWSKASGEMVKEKSSAVDQNTMLTFADEPLGSALARISEKYDVTITLTDDEMAKCPVTGRFPGKTVDDVLALIAGVYGMEISVDDPGRFILQGGRCD